MDVIVLDFLLLYRILFSPEVRQSLTISNKHGICELPHDFLNNLRLKRYSLRASDRFIQPFLLRICSCIGAFTRGNGCDICWSAFTGMGDSWPCA